MPTPVDWTLSQTKSLRHLTQDEATRLMDTYGLPDEIRGVLAQFIGTDVSAQQAQQAVSVTEPLQGGAEQSATAVVRDWHPPDGDRPLWLATAWLLGASYSTLARIHNVSPQAIQQSVNKAMPDATERHTHRIGYRVGLMIIQAYRIAYLNNVHILRGMSPRECAEWILANHGREDDEYTDEGVAASA